MGMASDLIIKHQNYFDSGITLDYKHRLQYLKKLKKTIIDNVKEIEDAIYKDLGKSPMESYMCEIGIVLSEISHMEKHLKKYVKVKKVRTPISQFPSKGYIYPSPYGNVLIMSPWNYPFNLSLTPLVDAIASGNTVILKPSNYSLNTSLIIKKIIETVFPEEYVSVVLGGRDVNRELLDNKYDYIFFTGGKKVARLVMEKASQNLTPVSLELGGKSPCIVCSDADIEVAAARIVFGKFLNAGQTCVAPDYLLVDRKIKDKLISQLKLKIEIQFGKEPLLNANYPRIINKKHFERLRGLLNYDKIIYGGYTNDKLQISPTLLDNITIEDNVMKDEIFGPILPIITFDSIENVVPIIKHNPNPLALYLFTTNNYNEDYIIKNINFGGGCINDTISHLVPHDLPFGGVGESGIGSYHGKNGFDTFSHYKSILKKENWLDISLRYQPYNEIKYKKIKKYLK